jgi:hypothetical protein
VLLIRLSSLRGHISGDHKDLSVWDLKHLAQIVQGDGRPSDLEHGAIRGWLSIDLTVMSHEERSAKLF